MSSLLQKRVRWVTPVRVFLDGLQEEGVASDPLHRHHQEEAQRCGVYFRPGGVNGDKEHRLNRNAVTGLLFIQV